MFTAIQFGGIEHKARIAAFAEGVRALGGRVVCAPKDGPADGVLALIKEHRPRFAFTCGMHHRDSVSRGIVRGCGLPLLVLDCGYFHRASGNTAEGYNQLGLDRLNWVPPIDCDDTRFAEHGITLQPPVSCLPSPVSSRSPIALILGQVPGDSQHHMSDIRLKAWLNEVGAELIAQGWRLHYRPHPAHSITRIGVLALRIDPASEPVAASIQRAALVVTYNSTAGLEALMQGVPVRCHPSAHYAGLQPGTPELQQHCNRLAWTQWTCAELRTGEPLRWMNQFANLLPDLSQKPTKETKEKIWERDPAVEEPALIPQSAIRNPQSHEVPA